MYLENYFKDNLRCHLTTEDTKALEGVQLDTLFGIFYWGYCDGQKLLLDKDNKIALNRTTAILDYKVIDYSAELDEIAEILEEYSDTYKTNERGIIYYFLSKAIRRLSDEMCNSMDKVYYIKKEPTPTTDQVQE